MPDVSLYGLWKIGDYATVSEIPFYLQGVQCEACHGEGKGHPEKGKLERKVTLGICRNCHTKIKAPPLITWPISKR